MRTELYAYLQSFVKSFKVKENALFNVYSDDMDELKQCNQYFAPILGSFVVSISITFQTFE